MTAARARTPQSGSRRPIRLPYGVLVGPFIAGAAVTLLIAAGTRQTITTTWMLGAILVGGVAATVAFVSTFRRHEPHLVAAARARARAAIAGPVPVPALVADDHGPGPAGPTADAIGNGANRPLGAARDSAVPPAPPQPDRSNDPLAHIHAVEDQGRRLRRDCVNCGTPVPLKAGACPSCGQPQVYQCKGCQTPIRLEWTQCPECGREVH